MGCGSSRPPGGGGRGGGGGQGFRPDPVVPAAQAKPPKAPAKAAKKKSAGGKKKKGRAQPLTPLDSGKPKGKRKGKKAPASPTSDKAEEAHPPPTTPEQQNGAVAGTPDCTGPALPTPAMPAADTPTGVKRNFAADDSDSDGRRESMQSSSIRSSQGTLGGRGKAKKRKDKKKDEPGMSEARLAQVEEWIDEIAWTSLPDPDEQVAQEQREGSPKAAAHAPAVPDAPAKHRPSLCGATLKFFDDQKKGEAASDTGQSSLRILGRSRDASSSDHSCTASTIEKCARAASQRGPRRSRDVLEKQLL
eukprot:TRINITY_DN70796_c0_g1_i1.p1 TRINITY_DN70796_c0_g1~~TRINITY_DN70796_c0_g1_i1.p1  ORF type:complete len:304 (+),score=53.01 TRINITY_DN70796_c0_g1_i1:148-1059(+)